MKKAKLKSKVKELESKLKYSEALSNEYFNQLEIISKNPSSEKSKEIMESILFQIDFHREAESSLLFGRGIRDQIKKYNDYIERN